MEMPVGGLCGQAMSGPRQRRGRRCSDGGYQVSELGVMGCK